MQHVFLYVLNSVGDQGIKCCPVDDTKKKMKRNLRS